MNYSDYLKGAYNERTGEFNTAQAQQNVYQQRNKINIVLLGATGVGKSSLINAFFGDNIVQSGVGQPITQHLQKIDIPLKGLTLWDTKGIEAKDYQATKQQLMDDLHQGFQLAFQSGNVEDAPHVAWLCIKESSSRIEQREFDLLQMLQQFGIPTVIVLTDTKAEAGDEFFQRVQQEINTQFADFIKQRYARVNSVEYRMMGFTVPVMGLDCLLAKTEDCLLDSQRNTEQQLDALRKAQRADIEKKLNSILASARKKVHLAAAAAATVGASPIPGSDAPLIAAIQSTMIYTLNAEFEVDSEDSATTSTITGILGVTAIAQVGQTVVANALKFIPGAGSIVGGAISATTAASITEAIGHAYIQVLAYYFDKDKGQVILPAQTKFILQKFESFLKLKKK